MEERRKLIFFLEQESHSILTYLYDTHLSVQGSTLLTQAFCWSSDLGSWICIVKVSVLELIRSIHAYMPGQLSVICF